MVKDREILAQFNREYIVSERTDYSESLRLFEAMWKEGVSLGVLPLKDPLEDIEVDIRMARILNHV